MQVKLRGNKVAIEKIKKVNKNQTQGLVIIPESEEYMGVIRYIGTDAAKDLEVGQKVYFGTNYQNVRMAGTDLCVMEDTQVYASVQD